MAKLQNIAKRLGNEVKNLQEGLKEEHERVPAACSVTQSTQDLLKDSEKRIAETSVIVCDKIKIDMAYTVHQLV